MNRIEQRFIELAKTNCKAFIPFLVAGDPSLEATTKLVVALERAGADIIELGVPFSDPIADGVVIQEASQRALLQGVTLRKVIGWVKTLREITNVPLLLFTYFNPVLAYGIEKLAYDASHAGIDGILCVDLPPEEADEYKNQMEQHHINTVFLLAPTSTDERIQLVSQLSSGFIYYVSRTGVTGIRNEIESTVPKMVDKIKKYTSLPVCVGFGVSTPEQAKLVASYADGVIVGSALVELVGKYKDSPQLVDKVGGVAKELAQAIKASKTSCNS